MKSPALWRNRRVRGVLVQALVLALLVLVVAWIVGNTAANLESRGIASGFAFLSSEAGFGIIQTLIAYDEASSYGRAFLVALLNTLMVSAIGIALATILGFVIGIGRLSRNWLVARLAGAYVELVRNVPLLLQLFFWYFAVLRNLPSPRQSITLADAVFLNIRGLYLPRPVGGEGMAWVWMALAAGLLLGAFWWRAARRHQRRTGQWRPVLWPVLALVLGLPVLVAMVGGVSLSFEFPELRGFNFSGGMVLIPELAALVLALSVYTAAFIAEIVRAGILSVDKGQTEAARALGLRRGLTLRLVIIPQAMRVIIPPLTSQYLNLVKNSSLAAAIAYPELVSVFAGTVLNQTGQAIEVIALTMAVYLTLSLFISALMNWYNRRAALQGR